MQQQVIAPRRHEILTADDFSDYIIEYCDTRQLFRANWDPHQFNWKKYSGRLCREHSLEIDIWWHQELFDWNSDATAFLIEDCKHFSHIWWTDDIWSRVTNEVYTTSSVLHLIFYFSNKFDIWWDEKFLRAPAVCMNLAQRHSYRFDKWFNKDLIPQTDVSVVNHLLKHRMWNFEEWYHPTQYVTHKHWDLIERWAQKYKHIWEADYVAFRLTN